MTEKNVCKMAATFFKSFNEGIQLRMHILNEGGYSFLYSNKGYLSSTVLDKIGTKSFKKTLKNK